MKQVLDKWCKELLDNPDDILGWTVCIVGTVRSAWLDSSGEITRHENEACRCFCKERASQFMNEWFDKERDLWRYMRLVPISRTKMAFAPYNGLPLCKGW